MKVDEWVGLIALGFIVVLVGAAVLPDDFWDRGGSSSAVVVGQGAATATNPTSWAGPAEVLPVAAKRADLAPPTTVAQPGLMPFENAPRTRFSGVIQQITELQRSDGQIHIWLEDPQGVELQISVAPSWFLKYMNCELTHDITISGTGFQFDLKNKGSLIYAKKIMLNGRACHLRNDEGFALWSSRLR